MNVVHEFNFFLLIPFHLNGTHNNDERAILNIYMKWVGYPFHVEDLRYLSTFMQSKYNWNRGTYIFYANTQKFFLYQQKL